MELSETYRVPCQNKIGEISASSWFYYKETTLVIYVNTAEVRNRNAPLLTDMRERPVVQ
jgi:hypothetical protein